MKEKIPSNVIIKTNYAFTKNLMSPHFVPSIIDQIMQYIKEHPRNYENLEIEAKLGRFEFKGDYVRNFEKINEIFVIPDSIHTPNPQNKFNFVAGILPRNFFLIWSSLSLISLFFLFIKFCNNFSLPFKACFLVINSF